MTEITKNFIVVDCKAKMEGMIPVEEFKNDDELSKLKVGSKIDVYLERIESFKGEIIISRDKARKMKAWKKMEKVFETQEELVGYITGRVKGGFICTVEGLPTFMPASQIDVRPLKKFDHLMNIPVKVIATRIDKNRGNVCTSRRAVLEKSKDAEVKEALKNLKEGDIVNVDVTAFKDGWHGDTSRMFKIGEISIKAEKLINTTYDSMMKAIKTIKANTKIGNIGYTIQKIVEAEGFSVVRDFCGHGIGKKFHESPNV